MTDDRTNTRGDQADTGGRDTTEVERVFHSLDLDQDEAGWHEAGWHYATCACGWQSPPCPDEETATDCYGDHRAATAPDEAPDA